VKKNQGWKAVSKNVQLTCFENICWSCYLDLSGHWWLVVVTSVDSLALAVDLDASLTVELGQSVKVQLWLLHDLDLAHVAVLNWVDWHSGLGDIAGDAVWEELLDELWHVAVGDLLGHDLGHLLSDLLDLLALGVGGLLDLVGALLLGESNNEHSKVVVVGGLSVNGALDHSLPLLDHAAHLVSGEAHTVEVQNAVLALNILAHELEFSVALAVRVQVSLVAVVNSTLEAISGDLVTDGSGDEGVADVSDLEDSWGLDGVPVLLGEWVDDLLLASLFGAFCKTLILAYGHTCLGVIFLVLFL